MATVPDLIIAGASAITSDPAHPFLDRAWIEVTDVRIAADTACTGGGQLVEIKIVAHAPCDHAIRAGGVTARADCANNFAFVVKAKAAAEDIHAADHTTGHRIVGLSEILGRPLVGDARVDRFAELQFKEAAAGLHRREQVGSRQCQPVKTEGVGRVGLLRRHLAGFYSAVDNHMPGCDSEMYHIPLRVIGTWIAWVARPTGHDRIMKKHEPLKILEITGAIVVPDEKNSGQTMVGVFDQFGNPVRQALLYRNYGQVSFQHNDPPKKAFSVEGTYLFGGGRSGHFGHFLLESLSRTWASEAVPDASILWTDGSSPNKWQSQIFNSLGLSHRHATLAGPTQFERLLVPDPGYRIQDFFHPTHVDFLSKAQIACAGASGKKVWLSRTKLAREKQFSGEKVIEEWLVKVGWEIIYPEKLSVQEQLQIFAHASVIAGIEGSAMHSVVLLSKFQAAVIIVRRSINQNYRTIASAKKFVQYELLDAIAIDNSLRERYYFPSPARTAQHIEELAKEHSSATESKLPHYRDYIRLSTYQEDNSVHKPLIKTPKKVNFWRRGAHSTLSSLRKIKRWLKQ